MEFDELSNRVIGCAIEVHWELGPGLLECLPMSSALVGVPGSIRGVSAPSSGSSDVRKGRQTAIRPRCEEGGKKKRNGAW